MQPRAKQSDQKHSDDMLLRLRLHDSGSIRASAWENIFIAASPLCCPVLGHWPIISAKWDPAGSNGGAQKNVSTGAGGRYSTKGLLLWGFLKRGPPFDTLVCFHPVTPPPPKKPHTHTHVLLTSLLVMKD